jgi:putative N6-adenine-specific DNA methylase
VEALRAPAPTGLVVANPPYGRRLGDPRAAARGYRDLGRVLRAHFRGWRAAVLVPARLDAGRALGLTLSARHALRNGGLPVTLAIGDVT